MTTLLLPPAPTLDLPWPDLDPTVADPDALYTRLIAAMRPLVRQTVMEGLWRAAQDRQRVRRNLPPLHQPVSSPLPPGAPFDGSDTPGERLIVALDALIQGAMDLLEQPARQFSGDERYRRLRQVFSRLSWLDGLLVRCYGEPRALWLFDTALEALLPG